MQPALKSVICCRFCNGLDLSGTEANNNQ